MAAFQKTTYKNLSKEESVRLHKFLCLPMEDLKKIKPVWVVEENQSEAFFGPFDEHEIEYISPKLLIDNANMLNLPTDKLFNNDIDDFRYITTLERWQEKRSVDPPKIRINNSLEKAIEFGDGRHRAILGYIFEEQSIPILVHKSQIDEYKLFISNNL